MPPENSGPERKPPKGSGTVMPKGRPFPKGTSGNPGGRPKEEREVVEAIRARGAELADVLLELAIEDRNVFAIKEAFDRGYGKAKQVVDLKARLSKDIDFEKMPPEQAEKVASLLEQLEALLRVDA